ncbi:hypothetical protein GCM10027361_23640 [Erwinia aphidicola]
MVCVARQAGGIGATWKVMGRSEKKIAPYGFSGNSLVTWKFMGRSEKKIDPYGFVATRR